jgi:calcineurin-like phosphoesterase family protein
MKTYLISDTHLNHDKIKTWCDRPDDFTSRIDENVRSIVKPEDLLIHLGDIGIGKTDGYIKMILLWGCRKVLVRGNHDQKSCQWYMDNGFDFACDGMIYRGNWLTHHPANALPEGTNLNIHGHLHNVWHGFHSDDPEALKSEFVQAATRGHLLHPWQRLFAIEYTDYRPVEYDKFVSRPDRYQARGPKKKEWAHPSPFLPNLLDPDARKSIEKNKEFLHLLGEYEKDS